jgi:hypothetical protein
MRPVFLFMFCLLLCSSQFLFAEMKGLMVRKTDSEIVVDGQMEPAWNTADSISDFVQYSPYVNQPPTHRTVARFLTTEKSLYCLIRGYQQDAQVQRFTGQLDSFGGDVMSFMIDTFGDKRSAYRFCVSASGVRTDCRLLDDARDRDYTWDGVWFSAAKIYDWGYIVEMEVPYRSIQYNAKLTEWGVDFYRWIGARSEDIYWCRYEENEGQRVSKFGRLVFENFQPSVRGLNLEIYPVGFGQASYEGDSRYDVNAQAGVDVFYNPSQQLTFQLTANPDFAQIEADPYQFNVTRYESYFEERRPFFTEGSEVFLPSGRERDSGFYRPLELFYSRRVGRKLDDGSEVPLQVGTRAFGRIGAWEYGGFAAMTGSKDYTTDDGRTREPDALFSAARIKRQILHNSSIGLLYAGKTTDTGRNGVIDVDGAFRASDWQFSYQIARSYKNDQGDFASSIGLVMHKRKFVWGMRGNYIGDNFDVDEIGFVPWKSTRELTNFLGPSWFFEKGPVQNVLLAGGLYTYYEKADAYTDRALVLIYNMRFRKNWGFEINLVGGRSRDNGVLYSSSEFVLSNFISISPKWSLQFNNDFAKTYNFSREYVAYLNMWQSEFGWRALDVLNLGASLGSFIEFTPQNTIEEITWNWRPFISMTPINNLNVRIYIDQVYSRDNRRVESLIGGFLFSYNFRPKSWIYFAVNELQDRSDEFDGGGMLMRNRLHTIDRVSVVKFKYLFYF